MPKVGGTPYQKHDFWETLRLALWCRLIHLECRGCWQNKSFRGLRPHLSQIGIEGKIWLNVIMQVFQSVGLVRASRCLDKGDPVYADSTKHEMCWTLCVRVHHPFKHSKVILNHPLSRSIMSFEKPWCLAIKNHNTILVCMSTSKCSTRQPQIFCPSLF